MGAPAEILDLIKRFEEQYESYRQPTYNETQLRREFVDPFFKALGWDIDNEHGYAEAYKEVIHEDSLKIGGSTKAPDYSFRIGGTRKFFVETKKPAVNIGSDASPAFQLRRYAWSAKLPLSILTDFEELAVYDGRVRPDKIDKASTARTLYLNYKQYEERWDEIASIFSRDAILKGSFDKYADSTKKKRGTAEVDDVFLSEIEQWRIELARVLAMRNPELSQRELNFAVQKTIDRIIFLRICEDRGMEAYGRLQMLLNGPKVYPRMCDLFRQADVRYNSGLFHFSAEKPRHEEPDEWTLSLNIDDGVLKEIIRKLYYPESPYEFSVISADILGQVYEQFLGKVIRLTSGHRAIVEDKPEVKKAGGVFYTPKYVVEYIVQNTVGQLLEGKSPNDVAARTKTWKPIKNGKPLSVLDPACGSGSFLIGAYQFLLDWHRDWYLAHDPLQFKDRIYQTRKDQWRLSTAERKRILLDHIYGVDIDTQAVEVTKLSLLLKVLEGETSETLRLFAKERALPDLGDNIKCGNSLIGPDYYRGSQLELFDDEERLRINAFDWQSEFPAIMKSGGFDAVIGNPPYIPIEVMTEQERSYYQQKHAELERKFDSSVVFILSLLNRLNANGLLGFISSVTWQTGENFSKLRRRLFCDGGVVSLVNLPFDVFKDAYVDTGVYVLSHRPINEYRIFRFHKKTKISSLSDIKYTRVPTRQISAPDFKIILDPVAHKILKRLSNDTTFTQLGEITISTQGLAAGRFSRSRTAKNNNWYPFLNKGQVYRYLFESDEIEHVNMNSHGSLRRFYEACPKIIIRRVINRQDRLMTAFTDQQMVFKKDINPFIPIDAKFSPFLLLGILNSKLVSYLYVNTSSIATKDDFRQTTLAELRRIPIPFYERQPIQQNMLVSQAKQMIALCNKVGRAKTSHERTALKRQIDALDREIDQLVYRLYGLTDDEIRIVEEATAR
ncbi:MAG: Eco57I restriction-modification methylase domain-containing protein [Planctomycetaceae bacterium]